MMMKCNTIILTMMKCVYINHGEVYFINHDEMYYINHDEMYFIYHKAHIFIDTVFGKAIGQKSIKLSQCPLICCFYLSN